MQFVNYDLSPEDKVEESKELSDKLRMMSMQSWLNVQLPVGKSNSQCLDEELKVTLSRIESFIGSLEIYSKVTGSTRFRKTKFGDEGSVMKSLDKIFSERISVGMHVMKQISELLRLEKLDYDSKSSVSEHELILQKLVARFANILESRGITHGLKVSELAKASLIEDEQKEIEKIEASELVEPSLEQVPSVVEVKQEEKEIADSVEFLHRVVSRNNLSLMFRCIPNKDPNSYQYQYACDFDQFTVTAKGPSRLTARNNSASKMVKLIMKEQLKGNSISAEKFALLTDDEMETAVKVLCLTENYVLKLRKVCEMHTAHFPKFTILSEKPVYTVKCEALGYKATGSHRRQYVAKKIAAKKVLLQMPNEGDDKHRQRLHEHIAFKRDKNPKYSTVYRESSLN